MERCHTLLVDSKFIKNLEICLAKSTETQHMNQMFTNRLVQQRLWQVYL